MKKIILALTALTAVSTAGADSLGLRANYSHFFVANSTGNFTFGVEYAYDLDSKSAVRVGVDLDPDVIGSGVFALEGDVAYLRNFDGVGNASYNVYYGGSLGLGVATAASGSARAYCSGSFAHCRCGHALLPDSRVWPQRRSQRWSCVCVWICQRWFSERFCKGNCLRRRRALRRQLPLLNPHSDPAALPCAGRFFAISGQPYLYSHVVKVSPPSS